LDDYADPIRAQYRLYYSKEDAVTEAKNRLQRILAGEEKLDRFDELAEDLENLGEAHIEGVSGGWQGDSALIRVAELFT
jgi:heme oxygenase